MIVSKSRFVLPAVMLAACAWAGFAFGQAAGGAGAGAGGAGAGGAGVGGVGAGGVGAGGVGPSVGPSVGAGAGAAGNTGAGAGAAAPRTTPGGAVNPGSGPQVPGQTPGIGPQSPNAGTRVVPPNAGQQQPGQQLPGQRVGQQPTAPGQRVGQQPDAPGQRVGQQPNAPGQRVGQQPTGQTPATGQRLTGQSPIPQQPGQQTQPGQRFSVQPGTTLPGQQATQTNQQMNLANIQQGVSLTAGPGGTIQVGEINLNSWARQAGLQQNDQIRALNGQPVADQQQFFNQLQQAIQSGQPAQLTVTRDGREQQIPLDARIFGGTQTGQLTNALNLQQGVNLVAGPGGTIQVGEININSWARQAGLQQNDRILGLNGQRIADPNQFWTQLMQASQQGTPAQLMIERNGRQETLPLNMQQILGSQGAQLPGANLPNASAALPGVAAQAGGALNANVGANIGLQDGITLGQLADGRIQVQQVAPNSWAAGAGIQPNDTLIMVGDNRVNNAANFFAQLQAQAQRGQPVRVVVDRNGQQQPISVDLSTFARGNAATPR